MDINKNTLLIKGINRINMNILAMARASLDEEWVCETARAPYSRVYMIQAGEGEITYQGKTVRLLPGNIYVIPAELDFAYSCGGHLEKLYFHVNILRYNQYEPEIIPYPSQKQKRFFHKISPILSVATKYSFRQFYNKPRCLVCMRKAL